MPNVQTHNQKTSEEIDISDLKVLGLPAESENGIEKLEENLQNDDFKQKLVCEVELISINI